MVVKLNLLRMSDEKGSLCYNLCIKKPLYRRRLSSMKLLKITVPEPAKVNRAVIFLFW